MAGQAERKHLDQLVEQEKRPTVRGCKINNLQTAIYIGKESRFTASQSK